ncbi:CHAT domain-containing protein [Leptolyngbya ohadii]|uniref:CHAT domain-containing protein n=1 Tax=Leptolyngbya ohadii TaxID=1962290 RepID=UPI000B5A1F95|nr:tetratricopeptide repeat protein [Leptolyngbya ohadii]
MDSRFLAALLSLSSIALSIALIPFKAQAQTNQQVPQAIESSSATENPSPVDEAERLFQQGLQQFQANQLQAAYESWQQALTLYRSAEVRQAFPQSRHREAELLQGIGRIYSATGQLQEALKLYEQALSLFREVGDRLSESITLNSMGVTYRNDGKYAQALEHYEQALAISRELGDRPGEGITLNNIGAVHNLSGQYSQALERFQQALAIVRELGDRAGEGRTLSNIGTVYENLGQYPQALQQYEQALAIRQEIGDRLGEGITLNNIGLIYNRLGQYPQALTHYQEALTIRRETGDRVGEAVTLSNMGSVYGDLGQYPQALQAFKESLTIAQELGDRLGEGTTLNNIGWAYNAIGDYSQALTYYQRAIAIRQSIGDQSGEADTLNNLGATFNNLKQYAQALNQFQQSLNIFQKISDRAGEGVALNNIGRTYSQQEQYGKAVEYYEQALAIRTEVGDRPGVGDTLSNIGVALYQTQQYGAAEKVLYQALEVLESLRASELSDAQKVALFDKQRTNYQALQQTLIAQNTPEKMLSALSLSERGRARAFVELLAADLPTDRSSESTSVAPPDISTIQRIASQQKTTLVQYSVIDNELGTALYIWVVNPNGEIQFRAVNLDTASQSLDQLVAKSRISIGARGRSATISSQPTAESLRQKQEEARQNLQQLYRLLIEPIAQYLPANENDRVIFIPQDELFLVPFAALIDANGNYLVQNHTILTAPSIQVLDLTHQQRQRLEQTFHNSDRTLVVGNPTMPEVWNFETGQEIALPPLAGAEQEAITVAQELRTTPLLRGNATETIVKQQMPSARIIHLATHGLLDYGDPQELGVRDLPGAIALGLRIK